MLCVDALAVVWRQKRIRHDVMQLQYSTVLYSTLQYSTVLYNYSTVLYSTGSLQLGVQTDLRYAAEQH